MFTDEHAELTKPLAGQKYRPANGTEGEIFMSDRCSRCVNDNPDADDHCDLLLRMMAFGIDDPEYPEQIQYGTDGQPTCTAFDDTPPMTRADENYLKWRQQRDSAA